MRPLPRATHSSGVVRSLSKTASLEDANAQREGSGAGAAVMARSSSRMISCVKWSMLRSFSLYPNGFSISSPATRKPRKIKACGCGCEQGMGNVNRKARTAMAVPGIVIHFSVFQSWKGYPGVSNTAQSEKHTTYQHEKIHERNGPEVDRV
jgi:hypothetical protein